VIWRQRARDSPHDVCHIQHRLLRADLTLLSVSNSAIAVLPALLGMMFGGSIRRRISPARFRRWFFVGLGLLALHLIHGAI
jgi:hypothetical protein